MCMTLQSVLRKPIDLWFLDIAFFSSTNLAYSPTSIWQKHGPISLSYNDSTSDSPLDNQVKIPAGLVSWNFNSLVLSRHTDWLFLLQPKPLKERTTPYHILMGHFIKQKCYRLAHHCCRLLCESVVENRIDDFLRRRFPYQCQYTTTVIFSRFSELFYVLQVLVKQCLLHNPRWVEISVQWD